MGNHTTINIGRNELVSFSNKLEKMGRSHLPVVVRQTLTSAAVNMKKKTMPEVFRKKFVNRNKSFLKSRSKFTPASGFEIASMKSHAGIMDKSDQATQDLAIQETGGIISGRTLIPMDPARVSKSEKKTVRKAFRLRNINAYQRIKSGDKVGLMKTAHIVGLGGQLIYGSTLFQVQRIIRVGSGGGKGNTRLKMIPLYDFQSGRSVNIKKRAFVSVAAKREGKNLNRYFAEHATKRLRK